MLSTSSVGVIEKKWGIYIVVAVAALGALWFAYAKYNNKDAQIAQKATAGKVAEDAAKSENPFRAANPLSNVEVNPFEKAKKVLNPFEQ